MLFGRKQDSRETHAVAVVRDIVEVVAIVAAGIWAFYVFAYENRIKPSMADPDINVSASMQRLSTHNGFIAVSLHLQLRNVGTVRAHFLGLAVNVYGQRIVAATTRASYEHPGTRYEFKSFYRTSPLVPVYSWAYVTNLGDRSSSQDTVLDPGSAIENERTFYVPAHRFDLLILGIDAPYTKFENETIPTHLDVTKQGSTKVVAASSPRVNAYNIKPVASLDIR
jgi:hypothetical protein